MKPFFITSTGTEIGKTLVTTTLCWQLRQKGKMVSALKPIISGWENNAQNDVRQIAVSLGKSAKQEDLEKLYLYKFNQPVSPDIAARTEGKTIEINKIVEFCRGNGGKEYHFIEGIGGIMTPLTFKETVLDVALGLNFSVILVIGCYLGTLSHTITAIELMKQKKMQLDRLVITNSGNNENMDEIRKSLANFTRAKIINIPYIDFAENQKQEKWKHMPDITSYFL